MMLEPWSKDTFKAGDAGMLHGRLLRLSAEERSRPVDERKGHSEEIFPHIKNEVMRGLSAESPIDDVKTEEGAGESQGE